MPRFTLAVLALTLAAGAFAQAPPEKMRKTTSGQDFLIEVRGEYKGQKFAVELILADGAAARAVSGGDTGFKVKTAAGEGVEFKKWGVIVNTLAHADVKDPMKINLQMQAEVSTPLQGEHAVDVATWQLETEFHVRKGKWKTVSSNPAKLEVRVSDAGE